MLRDQKNTSHAAEYIVKAVTALHRPALQSDVHWLEVNTTVS